MQTSGNSGNVYLKMNRLVELENDLKELKTNQRKIIAEKIAEARGHGDISENAEYDAAREAQALLELKISKIENILCRAKVINPDEMPIGVVHILSNVKVLDIDRQEEITFTLVSPEESDFELDKISITSPIGKFLLGKKIGDIVNVEVQSGIIKYKILDITK